MFDVVPLDDVIRQGMVGSKFFWWYFHVERRPQWWFFIRVSTHGWCPCSSWAKYRNRICLFTVWMGFGQSEDTFPVSWLIWRLFRAKSGCEFSSTLSWRQLLNGYLGSRWGASMGHSWRVSFLLLFPIQWHTTVDQTTSDIGPNWNSLASIINLYVSTCFHR